MNCSHALLSLFLLSPCGDDEGGTAARSSAPASPVAAAVAHTGRPSSDRERDDGRRPAQILDFLGIAPGMRVLDVHRVDPARVLEDFEGSCFTLEASSDLLANANDDHATSATDPAMRGRTDRFVYRFRKA